MNGKEFWKEVEINCDIETITAAELSSSKFLSLMGKSLRDYKAKKKIRKSDMSVEAITDAIHEYEKIIESPETEEQKKIRHMDKKTKKKQRRMNGTPTKARPLNCKRCGAPSWSKQHNCKREEVQKMR